MGDNSNFPNIMDTPHKLYRSRHDRILAGVCGGLGAYFNVDPLVFRAVFLVLVFGGGAGVLLYILLAIIIPNEPGEPVFVDRGEKVHDFAQDVAGRAKSFAEEVKGEVHSYRAGSSSRRSLIGLIIIVIGAALLLGQIFPVRWFEWNFFWPLLLIVIGIAILVKHGNKWVIVITALPVILNFLLDIKKWRIPYT